MRFEPAAVDVYYFAPQKVLASDGGLWLAGLLAGGGRAHRADAAAAGGSPQSLDLRIALENSRQDQTYNTPALATVFLAANQVDWILANGGLSWAEGRSEQSSGPSTAGPRRATSPRRS